MSIGSKADLAQALDVQPCMVRSLDGVIEYWTRGCEALYGWTAADAVGQRAQDLLKIQYPEPYEAIRAALLQDGEWTGELIKQTRAGDLRCISARWVLDQPGSGRPPRIVESAIDVTAFKQASEAARYFQDRLELAVSTFGLGITDYDPRSNTAVFSAEMDQILGVERGSLDGDVARWRAMLMPNEVDAYTRSSEFDIAHHVNTAPVLLNVMKPNGRVTRMRGVRRYLYDGFGRCSRIVTMYLDVTEQMEAEERLTTAVETFKLGINDVNLLTGAYTFSPKLEQMLGLPVGGLGSGPELWRSMIVAEDMERLLQGWEQDRVAGVRPAEFTARVNRADGKLIHLAGGVDFTFNACGDQTRAIGIFKDVTEEVGHAARVVDTRERLAAALDFYELGTVEVDLADRTYTFSPQLETLLGLPEGGLGTDNKVWFSMLFPDDLERVLRETEEQWHKGFKSLRFDMRARRADGRVITLRGGSIFTVTASGERTHGLTLFRDVTEELDQAARIKDAQERLAGALDFYELGIAEANFISGVYSFSPQMEKMLGLPVGGLGTDSTIWSSMIVTEDRARAMRDAEEDWKKGVRSGHFHTRARHTDGRLITLAAGAKYYASKDGDARERAVVIYRDVTAELDQAARLVEAKRRMDASVDFYGLGTIDVNYVDGIYTFSPQMEKMLGLPVGGLGTDKAIWWSVVSPEDRDQVLRDSEEQWKKGIRGGRFHLRVRHVDGRMLTLAGGVMYSAFDTGDTPLRGVAIFRDVTDELHDRAEVVARGERLIAMQAELIHASRVSAMGEMAMTLAHELNQPLTAVAATVGAIKALSRHEVIDGLLRTSIVEAANHAGTQAVRAGEIVRRLRQFIAKNKVDVQTEAVDNLVDDAMALALPNPAADNIEVRRTGKRAGTWVLADRIQIQQVLVNLIRNAAEAMRGQHSPKVLTVSVALRGTMTVVDVADTGPGISPEIGDHLFTPFTSTKSTGMGVGLSICCRILEANGGTLWLNKEAKSGASFRFTLPSAQGAPA